MPFLTIAFPVFDPIAIAIGPIAIRWYALAYIGGIVLGWIYARSLVKKERLWGGPAPITLVQLDDFILWVTIGIIVGGRTGYVLFYNPVFFIQHPAEIFQLWNGGMSFHGGFLGCVAAVMLFARKNDISILSLGDITTAVGPIGLFLGRLANFINSELWGRVDDPSLPWGMVFPNGGSQTVTASLFSLNGKDVKRQDGRLVATGDKGKDRLKWVGIGAGAELGFLGRTSLDALGTASLNGYYHFKRDGSWKPFATAGYSSFFTLNGHSNLANIGAGLNYWYKERLGIKLEIRDHFATGTNSANYLEFRFGFNFK